MSTATRSPFPGMDPYLEQYWRDVQHRLCTYSCDALQPQIRPALLARIEERLVVESLGLDRSMYPDVRIAKSSPEARVFSPGTATGVAEPIQVTLQSEPVYEGFIQILDPAAGGALVTVIEFLSISNKRSKEGIEQYRTKLEDAVKAGVSVVEIDLLRGGEWVVQVPQRMIPSEKRRPYRACVRHAWKADVYTYYHFPIEERLLKLPIPLRKNDPDALLDLQDIVDRIYQNGAYDQINYNLPPLPEFDEETERWVKGRLSTHRR